MQSVIIHLKTTPGTTIQVKMEAKETERLAQDWLNQYISGDNNHGKRYGVYQANDVVTGKACTVMIRFVDVLAIGA